MVSVSWGESTQWSKPFTSTSRPGHQKKPVVNGETWGHSKINDQLEWVTVVRYPYNYLSPYLVGGFNPVEKYLSNWIISPRFGMKIKNIWNHNLGNCGYKPYNYLSPYVFSRSPFSPSKKTCQAAVEKIHGCSLTFLGGLANPMSGRTSIVVFHNYKMGPGSRWATKKHPYYFPMKSWLVYEIIPI